MAAYTDVTDAKTITSAGAGGDTIAFSADRKVLVVEAQGSTDVWVNFLGTLPTVDGDACYRVKGESAKQIYRNHGPSFPAIQIIGGSGEKITIESHD